MMKEDVWEETIIGRPPSWQVKGGGGGRKGAPLQRRKVLNKGYDYVCL